MEYFDVYYFEGTESELFFARPIEVGQRVWLDGIDGFFDQYFEGCAAIGRNKIRFVAIGNGVKAIPTDCSEFEALPLVEASIVNNQMLYAEVEITKTLSLGDWARTVPLLTEIRWNDLVDSEVSEMFSELLRKTLAGNCTLQTFPRRVWKHSRITAIYLFKTDSDTRCIILEDNTVPSALFRVKEEF